MPLLELDHVCKSYGELAVLKDVSLAVEKGEVAAIIGRSGSGKSTLLRCINGLEKIDSGTIRFSGEILPAGGSALRELRKRIGIVFQSYNLFPHKSVEDNITLAPIVAKKMDRSAAKALAGEMLKLVNLEDKRYSFPAQLSGGQQQRVAIARSLAMQPELMLFDEITSALDPELVGEVVETLENLARRGGTMILVTHEMGFARHTADTLVFMHKGRIWEKGDPKTLFRAPQTPELAAFVRSVLRPVD